jgi:hypothetical protein
MTKQKEMTACETKCNCKECNKVFNMGCTEEQYDDFIKSKMDKWNETNEPKMNCENTIITAIRPYESFVEDKKYNIEYTEDEHIIFNDNCKKLLDDYYHYTNYQPYFYYLDFHSAEYAYRNWGDDYKNPEFFNKLDNNNWDDKDTEYWETNIFKKPFTDIYVNLKK